MRGNLLNHMFTNRLQRLQPRTGSTPLFFQVEYARICRAWAQGNCTAMVPWGS